MKYRRNYTEEGASNNPLIICALVVALFLVGAGEFIIGRYWALSEWVKKFSIFGDDEMVRVIELKAVDSPESRCEGCYFFHSPRCTDRGARSCSPENRADGKHIIWTTMDNEL